ncbi:dihydropyrimidinase [Aeoliella sp. ICT_H6.2]|uniref:Dihydropyrimidinase n=1 Tax=Aeoliella straminimaris TaxID=2954799 RepID=A0A9X2FEE2_9BACT|nr:dihydropyrimidinase [Aeoliella straminimaris]MCO6047627.1 dihydropyrimidinase [Aeoliella straminimaris]
MALLIKNGNIVTATDSYVADILCEDGKIAAIGHDLSAPVADEVVDATGHYVFPGFIDPHVHIYLPFMGTFAKDDYNTASRAALVGGTTTLIEMCCPSREEDPLEAFDLWLGKAQGISSCDYTFHMGVSRFDDNTEQKLRTIVERGIASFKVFLAYKGFLGVNDDELCKTLKLAQELGVIVTAHCENETLIAERQQQLLAEGKTGPEWHEPSRPVQVEAEGVHHLMAFAEATGAHVYVVHTSCEPAIRAAEEAKMRGVNVWVETVIPYLTLDSTYAEQGDFEGAKYVMSPPIRAVEHQNCLWNALRSRSISTVATDHAPFDFVGQKEMGRDDFTKIPNGLPSIEDRVNLLYTYGVKRDKIDLHTFVDAASTQAAKLFGLFPRKGTIALGSDADLVVYDPMYRGTIAASKHHMATDYNPYEGWPIEGRPSLVTLRGNVQVRDGQFIGKDGIGEFLKRDCTH